MKPIKVLVGKGAKLLSSVSLSLERRFPKGNRQIDKAAKMR
jgi:hypothetical protein